MKPQVGFVYFIKLKESGNIKIGFARWLSQRLQSVEREQGQQVELLGTVRGTIKTEMAYHRYFSDLEVGDRKLRRAWQSSELFRPESPLIDLIESDKVDKQYCERVNYKLRHTGGRIGKLPDHEVIKIREEFAAGASFETIGEKYNLSWRHLKDIINGRKYRKAGGPTFPGFVY